MVEEFDHRDLGAEPGVDRPHLKPDDARADHDHALGDLAKGKRAGGGDDGLLVDLDAGQGARLRAGGDDGVLGLVDLVPDLDLAGLGDGAPAFQPVDLVLLEQELDPAGVAVHDRLLVILHDGPVDRRCLAFQPHGGKVVLGLVKLMRRMQQRLGGDAADVETGPAEGLATFHAGGLEAKLGTTDSGDVASGA